MTFAQEMLSAEARGEATASERTARKMLQGNEPLNKISDYTGLSIDAINNLKSSLNINHMQ